MLLLSSQVFMGSVVLFDHEGFDTFNVWCVLVTQFGMSCDSTVAMLDLCSWLSRKLAFLLRKA